MSLPTTVDRVPRSTAQSVNQNIAHAIEASVRHFAVRPDEISGRLAELRAEWDIERAIEMNASALAFIGVMLGFFVHPYWLALPATITAFLFQHAIQGWCPPVPVLRRLGFRTAYEIDEERYGLKAVRGDFDNMDAFNPDKAATAISAVRKR